MKPSEWLKQLFSNKDTDNTTITAEEPPFSTAVTSVVPTDKVQAEKLHIEINSIDDAKALFVKCGGDYHYCIKKRYDEETNAAFDNYSSSEIRKKWALQLYCDLLTDIAGGDTNGFEDKLSKVNGIFNMWLGDGDDLRFSLYSDAWQKVLLNEQITLADVRLLTTYLSLAIQRCGVDSLAKLLPCLKYSDLVFKELFSDEYEKQSFNSPIAKYKDRSSILRAKVREGTLLNAGDAYFDTIDEDTVEVFYGHYRSKYKGSTDAMREIFNSLNCGYGASCGGVLLTGMNYEADSYDYNREYTYKFVAVIYQTGQVKELVCRRSKTDGRFEFYLSPDDEQYKEDLSAAIEFYRNLPARKAFEEQIKTTLSDLKQAAKMRVLSSIPTAFGYLKERLSKDALAEKIDQLIDYVEELAPDYGIENTIFGEPATLSDIIEWENTNKCKLPESYRMFLLFANGAVILNDSTRIAGLDSLITDAEYMDRDYIIMGSLIGDGTLLCFSRSTSEIVMWDHSEIRIIGDMSALIDKIIRF